MNNAGIGGASALIGDYPDDSWDKVIEVNLNSIFHNLKAQLPAIAANGGGAVVNVASILGSVGFAELVGVRDGEARRRRAHEERGRSSTPTREFA